MPSLPDISVIMPVYNRADLVSEAIDSMLAQTFPDFEFIILDDGSMDKSVEIIRSYKDPRISVLVNPFNLGNYPSRNRGMAAARGKYICVMDSDDIALPHRLAAQFDFMEANPEAGIAGSNFCYIPQNKNSDLGLSYEEFKVGLVGNNMIFCHPTLIMRKSLLSEFHLTYDEKYIFASDYDLLIRGSQYFPIVNMPDILLQYRRHNDRITSGHSTVQRFMAKQIMRKYLDMLGFFPTDEEMGIHFQLMWGGTNSKDKTDVVHWIDKLTTLNQKNGCLDQHLLQALLDKKSAHILL